MSRQVFAIVGIVLIALGVLALVYGGFTYTQETHDADLGPLEVQVEEQETVNVPMWAGVAAIALGTVSLFGSRRKPTR